MLWSLTNGIQHANNECWKITGIHLKFVYLVKPLIYRQTNLSPENLEDTNNFESCGLTLVAYKSCNYFYGMQVKISADIKRLERAKNITNYKLQLQIFQIYANLMLSRSK